MDLSTIASAFLAAWFMLVPPTGTQAYQRADELPQLREPSSGRFHIEGNFVVAPQRASLQGDGAFVLPDRIQLAMEAAADGQRERIELIVIGDTAYSRTGRSTRWDIQDVRDAGPGVRPPRGTTPDSLDPRIVEAMGGTRLIGVETLRGNQAERYHLDVDLLALAETYAPGDPTIRAELQTFTMSLDFWVGVRDRYLHQMQLAIEARARGPRPGTPDSLAADLLIAFSDFDQPISIVAPVGPPPTAAAPTTPAPVQVPAQVPARAPARLPNTGQAPAVVAMLPLLGWLLVILGLGLRRRTRP